MFASSFEGRAGVFIVLIKRMFKMKVNYKEPGRHAKIPISRRNRNELYLTKKISIFIRF